MKYSFLIPVILYASVAHSGVVFSDFETDTQHGLNDSYIESGSSIKHKLPAHEILNGLAPRGWKVNLGPGMSNYLLGWEPAVNWRTAVMKIQKINKGVYIVINEEDNVIAASTNREHLNHLQSRNPNIWVMNPKLSLRKNLEVWNDQSNIDIIWGSKFDFEVKSHSVLVGNLTGKGGVLDLVIQETLKSDEPLWVSFSPEIGAAHILPGGSTQKAK